MSTRKKYLGQSELARIGKWRANLKGRRFWTETDEEILQIILGLNDKKIGGQIEISTKRSG